LELGEGGEPIRYVRQDWKLFGEGRKMAEIEFSGTLLWSLLGCLTF